MKKSYVMIHVIKHEMDPNSDINYGRKIGPLSQRVLTFGFLGFVYLILTSNKIKSTITKG
jgi:hypothetical protein